MISTKSDGKIAQLAQNLSDPSWMKEYIDRNMVQLSRHVAGIMRSKVRKHRYTGGLEEGVKGVYNPIRLQAVIESTAMRGSHDAGLLLEYGTRPIRGLPFEPIRRWAEFRGLPAGPVWYKIVTKGVSAHPWLVRLSQDARIQTAIENTARRIGIGLVGQVVAPGRGPLVTITGEA